ncbi:hypothetical protein [Catenulispora subtropica]
MSDEQNTTEARSAAADSTRPQAGGDGRDGRDDLVDTVIGLAVLGLGAAVMAGGMSLGGVLRGLTRGTPPRTPPIGPR